MNGIQNREVSGEEVQETNLLVSQVFSDMFKSTFGPLGLNKLIVKDEDFDLVSSNGLYIINELDYDHPTAEILIKAGKIQGDEIGDGVSTLMILIGELIKKGFDLKSLGVPFPIVIKAYAKSIAKVKEILGEIAIEEELNDEFLLKVASSSLKQYGNLADIVVNSVKRISDEKPIDPDDVTIVAEVGKGEINTQFFDGVVVDRTGLRDDIPKRIKNGKISLLNVSIERRKARADAKLTISDPSHIRGFKKEESGQFSNIIDAIVDSGADIVLCQKAVSDEAADMLGRAGIVVLKRVKNTDMKRISKSTKAEIIDDILDISSGKLGRAKLIYEKKIGNNRYILFENCPKKRSSAIIIRGGDIHVLEGITSEVKNAIRCVAIAIEDQRILPGGGAVEVELASRLRKYANTLTSKEQLAVSAFADSLDEIPKTLAKNLGMDPIDTLIDLRKKHYDNPNIGIQAEDKKTKDMILEGIIDPFSVKIQAFTSAVDVAMGMLKIDDLVIAKQKPKTGLRQEYEAPEFKYRRGRIKY